MPKVIGTRKQEAKELLERLERGPSLDDIWQPLTPEEASRRYRQWAESWVIPVVKRLVPELREKKA